MNPSIYHGLLPETLSFGGLALWSWWEYRTSSSNSTLSKASKTSTGSDLSTPASISASASFQPNQAENQAKHGTWERDDQIDPEVGLSDGAEMRKLAQFLLFLATSARWLTCR